MVAAAASRRLSGTRTGVQNESVKPTACMSDPFAQPRCSLVLSFSEHLRFLVSCASVGSSRGCVAFREFPPVVLRLELISHSLRRSWWRLAPAEVTRLSGSYF